MAFSSSAKDTVVDTVTDDTLIHRSHSDEEQSGFIPIARQRPSRVYAMLQATIYVQIALAFGDVCKRMNHETYISLDLCNGHSTLFSVA